MHTRFRSQPEFQAEFLYTRLFVSDSIPSGIPSSLSSGCCCPENCLPRTHALLELWPLSMALSAACHQAKCCNIEKHIQMFFLLQVVNPPSKSTYFLSSYSAVSCFFCFVFWVLGFFVQSQFIIAFSGESVQEEVTWPYQK